MHTTKKPRGYKVPARSKENIRQIAKKARAAFSINETRVDLKKLLERTLPKFGVNYDIYEDSEMPDDEAVTYPALGVIKIRLKVYMDLIQDKVRPRFTIPHEIGHFLLHQDTPLARSGSQGSHKFYQDSEWQADTFSAEFMMPVELVQKHCNSIEDIARIFHVSQKSANIRADTLRKEGLISW